MQPNPIPSYRKISSPQMGPSSNLNNLQG